MVEQQTFNLLVQGSTPWRPTRYNILPPHGHGQVLGNLRQAAVEAPSLPPAGTFRLVILILPG